MSEEERSTEEKILAAARKVFVAKGMAGARMQDIADEAGINKALLHYYFRSKEKLFEVIFSQTVGRFIPRVNEIFSSEMSWIEKVETFAAEYIDKVLENPFLPLFVINEMHKQPEEFLNKMWGGEKPKIEKFQAQLADAIAKKEIKPVHPAHLIMNIMSLCVFPFVGKPLLQMLSGVSEETYLELLKERKTLVPQFIIQSLKV